MRFRNPETSTWLVLALLLLALALRLYHLDHQNLWLDEALTWWDSQLPTFWLLRRSALNVHPPGVFLLMKLWTSLFGSSPAMLRLPFVLSSLLILALSFRLTRLLLPTRVALLTALLLVLSPYHIYFAQEARMYTLATALTLGAVVCYLRLWPSPRIRTSAGLGFMLLFAAALHTHYFSAFILAAVNSHFLCKYFNARRQPVSKPGALGGWIKLNVGVLLACLPWLLFVLLHPGQGVKQDWRAPLSLAHGVIQLRDMFLHMTVGYNVYPHDLVYAFNNYLTYPEAPDARRFFLHRFLIFGLGAPVMVGVFINGVRRLRRQGDEILFLFLVPLLMMLGVLAVVQREMKLSRYLMLASPYFLMILAVGIMSLKTVRRRLLAASPLLLAMVLALTTYYRTPTRGSDFRPVANVIRQQVRPGDVIVVDPFYMDRCLFYYLEAPSLRRATVNTEWNESISEYLLSHAALPRVWLVLDHRSDLFGVKADGLRRLWPSYAIHMDALFPERFSRVRLLLLQFARRSEQTLPVRADASEN